MRRDDRPAPALSRSERRTHRLRGRRAAGGRQARRRLHARARAAIAPTTRTPGSARICARAAPRAPYLGIHQRLDRDTSGVLVFTRRKEANRAVAEQFEGRTIEKTLRGVRDRPRPARSRRPRASPRSPGRTGDARRCRDVARGQEAVTAGARSSARGRSRAARAHAGDGAHPSGPRASSPPRARRSSAIRSTAARRRRGCCSTRASRLTHRDIGEAAVDHVPQPRRRARSPRGSPTESDRRSRRSTPMRFADALRARAPSGATASRRAAETTAFRIVNDGGDGLARRHASTSTAMHLVALYQRRGRSPRASAILDAATSLGPRGVYLKVGPSTPA